jgi:hypothetical protein
MRISDGTIPVGRRMLFSKKKAMLPPSAGIWNERQLRDVTQGLTACTQWLSH